MNHDDVVDECRRAFAGNAPAWPAGLIRFLDEPPGVAHVFGWVLRCTRRLLLSSGEATSDLEKQLALLESYINDSAEVAVIRETMEQLWVQRSPDETAKTAVVQLFGSLIQYREGDIYRHLACTVSITMLVRVARNRREMFEMVLEDFEDFVRESRRTSRYT